MWGSQAVRKEGWRFFLHQVRVLRRSVPRRCRAGRQTRLKARLQSARRRRGLRPPKAVTDLLEVCRLISWFLGCERAEKRGKEQAAECKRATWTTFTWARGGCSRTVAASANVRRALERSVPRTQRSGWPICNDGRIAQELAWPTAAGNK